jgi:hypothetical protein
MTRSIRLGTLSILGLALVVAGVTAINTIHTRHSAERFFASFTHLKIGASTAQDAERLAVRFGGMRDCSHAQNGNCTYWVTFENTWLSRLRLAPRARLVCTILVREGVVSGRHFSYSLWDNPPFAPSSVDLWEPPHAGWEPPSPLYVHGQWSGGLWRMYVSVSEDATPEQRHIAYSLNLSCLWRIGGCKRAESLLPPAVPLVKKELQE